MVLAELRWLFRWSDRLPADATYLEPGGRGAILHFFSAAFDAFAPDRAASVVACGFGLGSGVTSCCDLGYATDVLCIILFITYSDLGAGFGGASSDGNFTDYRPKGTARGVGALGLVAVLVTVCFYDGSTEFPGLAALPPVLGAAALIWAGTAGPVVTSHLLSLRPMVWVGLISYSLYLWHWPIMAFARNWLFTVELDLNWQAATVLASFAAGGISWRFIERPFRVPVRDGGMTQGRIFALSGAGMAVLGVLAGACITSESVNALRFSQEELAFLRDDGFDPRALECREKTRLEDFCQFGNVAGDRQPKWIVWGDSHAEAMMPAFDALAHEKNESLLHAVRPGCAPLPEVERLEHSPVQRRRCLEMKRQVERFLMESGQIDTVFLHARWPLYVEGSRYGPAEMQKITLLGSGLPEER